NETANVRYANVESCPAPNVASCASNDCLDPIAEWGTFRLSPGFVPWFSSGSLSDRVSGRLFAAGICRRLESILTRRQRDPARVFRLRRRLIRFCYRSVCLNRRRGLLPTRDGVTNRRTSERDRRNFAFRIRRLRQRHRRRRPLRGYIRQSRGFVIVARTPYQHTQYDQYGNVHQQEGVPPMNMV